MGPDKKRLVLVVDDEPDLVAVLSQRIGKGGFSVATAADGEEGLAKTRALHPDVIVLDVAMPKVDGWRFCQRIRRDPALKDTPILILTAWLTNDLKRRAEAAGAARILLKPFDENEVLETLRRICPASKEV
ncbi:MAG: response regulator [Elusimicrobia bacterium]|nr:response regulator [Elusimicrobiota bacterium]